MMFWLFILLLYGSCLRLLVSHTGLAAVVISELLLLANQSVVVTL